MVCSVTDKNEKCVVPKKMKIGGKVELTKEGKEDVATAMVAKDAALLIEQAVLFHEIREVESRKDRNLKMAIAIATVPIGGPVVAAATLLAACDDHTMTVESDSTEPRNDSGTTEATTVVRDGKISPDNKITCPNSNPAWLNKLQKQGGNYKVVVDNDGNSYALGLLIDRTIYHDRGDMYITKYDSQGKLLWEKPFMINSKKTYGADMVLDKSGDLLVTGTLTEQGSSSYYSATFVCKISKTGDKKWDIVDENLASGWGIAIGTDNNIYITGYGEKTLPNGTYSNIFISKVSSDGKLLCSKLHDHEQHGLGRSITSDSDGNLYITGETGESDPDFNDAVFLGKYDTSCNEIWSKTYKPKCNGRLDCHAYGEGIAVDINKNIYLAGSTEDSSWVASTDPKGNLKWQDDTGINEDGKGIKVDNNGNVFTTGTLFGKDAITFKDYGKSYIKKYDQNGNPLWSFNIGGIGLMGYPYGIALDNKGHIFVAGVADIMQNSNTYLWSSDFYVGKFKDCP